jgi:hypothetical protein
MQETKSGLPNTKETLDSYSDDGVDLTLIRWMLSMTPTDRLRTLQQNVRSIMRLRGDEPHQT